MIKVNMLGRAYTVRVLRNNIIVGILMILFLGSIPLPLVQAQVVNEDTVSRRDLVIDLGGGLTTDAQLTLPAIGSGPFPGVLLMAGSGAVNMDEHIPVGTATGQPVKPFLQIAEYLSERGFAVLRYNKRGVDTNYTNLNYPVTLNWTYQDLAEDAAKALEILAKQDEVDTSRLSIVGHSEGSFVGFLVAAGNPNVKNLVLMGTAHHPHELAYWQQVDLQISYATKVLDSNSDGLISIEEVLAANDSDTPITLPANSMIENSTGEYRWYPGLDASGDGYFSISEELKPRLLQIYQYVMTAEFPGSVLIQSAYSLESMMDTIQNVSASILILHGEEDFLTPLEEALLLEQKLTEIRHPDHTLITYPGFSHYFYPSDGYRMAIGPIQQPVLSDLAAWLKDPARTIRYVKTQIQAAEDTIDALQSQLARLNTTITLRTGELQDIQKKASQLTNNLNTANQQINDLEGQLAAQIQRLTQELQTAKNETIYVKTSLTSDLDKANQQIDGLQGQVTTLQSQSSNLENTITELQSRNNELQTAFNTSTTLAYIAIIIAIVAIAAAVAVVMRRH